MIAAIQFELKAWLKRNAIGAFVVAPLMTLLTWWLIDRTPPYTFTHVEIVPHDVPQGGEHDIVFTTKENRPTCGPGLVYREYRAGAARELIVIDPIMRAEAPEIREGKFTRKSRLPETIPLGPAVYRGRACYNCNPTHEWIRWPVCAVTEEVPFNVIAKPQ